MRVVLPFRDVTADPRFPRRGDDLAGFEFTYKAELTNVYPLTSQERLFQIRIADPVERSGFTFRPGQFVMLEVPGIGEAPFSITSSPSRHGDIELCIRRVGNLTNFLHRVDRGLQVGLRGPFGTRFPVEEMEGQNVLLVAGGLGLAALRAPILAVLENRSRYERVEIVYGARDPSSLLFTYQYDTWRQFDIQLDTIVETPAKGWTGPVGRITAVLKDTVTRFRESLPAKTYAIVCGPPVMFKFVCSMLSEAGVPMEKMFVSLERRMHCGHGKCCRCNVGSTYTCLEGPVFDYWTLMNLKEAI